MPGLALPSNPSTNDALSHCAEVPIQNLRDLAVGVLSKRPAHPTEFMGKLNWYQGAFAKQLREIYMCSNTTNI